MSEDSAHPEPAAPVPEAIPFPPPLGLPPDGPADVLRVEGPEPAPAAGPVCHGSASCRRLLVLGSIAGGLGLTALATGAALLARPLTVDPADPTALVNWRPAGAAAMAVGAGLAATCLLTLLAARKAGRLAQRLRVAGSVP